MTPSMPTQLAIPKDWLQAATFFADLRERLPLSPEEWKQISEWLATTAFDDHSYLAREVAACLVRDFGPGDLRKFAEQQLKKSRLRPHQLPS